MPLASPVFFRESASEALAEPVAHVGCSPITCARRSFIASALSAADEPAKLSVAESQPPSEVAEPIRATLDGKALRLSNGDKPFFEFWFRKELPLVEKPADGTLGLTTMQEGTVLGVVRVGEDQYDFRNEEIPKGVYIVRLGLQPEDGNHLGSGADARRLLF